MNRGQWNIRKTTQRQQQIKRIQMVTGTNSFATVIDYALARAIAEFDAAIRLRDRMQRMPNPEVFDLDGPTMKS